VDFTNHPFLNVLWTFFMIFVWISWFMLVIRVVADVFRRRDIGGGAKAIWVVLVVFLPLLGTLLYLITQGGKMAERDHATFKAQEAEAAAYIRQAAGSGGPTAEIERAAALRDSGVLTEAEFQALKARALA